MKQTILLALLAMASMHICAQTTHPNIIVILVDDLNDWVAGYNNPIQTKTPNILKLEKIGTTFTNTHCVAPICGPSRTSFLSGKDPYYTQDYTNSKCVSFESKFSSLRGNETLYTLPKYLKDSIGYYTCNIGKVFDCSSNNPAYYSFDDLTLDPCIKLKSWNEYYTNGSNENEIITEYADTLNAGISLFLTCAIPDSMETDMNDYISTDHAIQFIEGVADGSKDICDKPFALFVGLRKPHSPWIVPEKYFLPYYNEDYTTEDYDLPYNTNETGTYNGLLMPAQPEIRWEDYYNLPDDGLAKFLADYANVEDSIIAKIEALDSLATIDGMMDTAEIKFALEESVRANMILAYLAGIKFMDAQIGRIFKELKSHPDIYSNTIIVIAGDNGFTHGEKRHWSKASLWEPSLRVPLIIADMRNPIKRKVNQQVSLLDVYPTIIELIGAEAPTFPDGTAYLDGNSLVELMTAPTTIWSSPTLASFKSIHGPQLSCFPQYSVKDNEYHYIRYQSNNAAMYTSCNEASSYFEKELYHIGTTREIDPNEWNNLINDSAYLPEVEYLEQFLPGGSMYLMKSFQISENETVLPCFISNEAEIQLNVQIYNDKGVSLLTLPKNYVYAWSNNINKEVSSSNHFQLNTIQIKSSSQWKSGKILVYLKIIDTVSNSVVGFKMFSIYTNANQEPEIYFDLKIRNGNQVTLENISISGRSSNIVWDFGDGFIEHGNIPSSHTYAPGNYTLTASAYYGNNKCEKIFSKEIHIDSNQINAFEILSMPNPASSYVDLFLPESIHKTTISILNMQGEFITSYDQTLDHLENKIKVAVKDLPAGFYTIQIEGNNKFYYSKVAVIK